MDATTNCSSLGTWTEICQRYALQEQATFELSYPSFYKTRAVAHGNLSDTVKQSDRDTQPKV